MTKWIVIGLDPGPKKSGWALYNLKTQQVLQVGHDDWNKVRSIIYLHLASLYAICVEQVIMHMGLPPSRLIIDTATNIGRVEQICEQSGIRYFQNPRIDICELVSGVRPKPGTKVTKKDMQIAVQKLLDNEKVIRPQHANDAVAAILAEYPPNGRV